MTRPQLAVTYKIISEEGAHAFYNGSLTGSILEDLKDIGSIITRTDLLNYVALEKNPLEVILNGGIKMVSPPPPGSGAVLSFILNILDGYNFTDNNLATDSSSTLTYHRMIEAFKFAYAKRTNLGDEDFVNVTELVQNLTSKAYADSIRKLITDNETHSYEYYGPTFYDQETTGTSHMSVLDHHGNAVSVTSTINGRFGSYRRGTRTGIIFNNEMDDFSSPNITNEYGIPPSPANFIIPGKRPLSSMCPAVFINLDGSANLVLGAAGGSKITTSTAWVAAHVLWLGLSIEKAIEIPRLHHQLLPPWISFETGFKESLIQALRQLGHNATEFIPGQSVVQGIDVRDGFIYAVSDYRKGGTPNGY
uniref:Gamma-glutamyltransferase n=1 Tax=Arion vulgaris TaxID=1028688 RepID=A0A0B7AUX9_9EUPU